MGRVKETNQHLGTGAHPSGSAQQLAASSLSFYLRMHICCTIYPWHETSVTLYLQDFHGKLYSISLIPRPFIKNKNGWPGYMVRTAFDFSLVRLHRVKSQHYPRLYDQHQQPPKALVYILTVRNTISPHLCHLIMLVFLLYEY